MKTESNLHNQVLEKNCGFDKNSDFLVHISLQPNVADLTYFNIYELYMLKY